MNKLITKARSGVTLVELLVVILIVTILSVSMLPLLQPFVVESQYAAEAIPVIGNIRTKIGVYVYDKGKLPYDNSVLDTAKKVETWCVAAAPTGGAANDDIFAPATYDFTAQAAVRTTPISRIEVVKGKYGGHIQNMLDIDYQDLKGKRSKPLHYQYLALNTNTLSYVIGCFGDGNGLKVGTGYAVCELNFPAANRKLIGTWKRYKSYNDEAGAVVFTSDNTAVDPNTGKVLDCYVPDYDTELKAATTAAKVDDIVKGMTDAGWEF